MKKIQQKSVNGIYNMDLTFEELSKINNPIFMFCNKHFPKTENHIFTRANFSNNKIDKPIIIYNHMSSYQQKIYAKFTVNIDVFYKWYTDCLVNYYPNEKECIKIYKQFSSKDMDSAQLAASLIFGCHSNFITLKKLIVSLFRVFKMDTFLSNEIIDVNDFLINTYYQTALSNKYIQPYLKLLKSLDNQNNLPIETKSTIEKMLSDFFFEDLENCFFKLKLNLFDVEIQNV